MKTEILSFTDKDAFLIAGMRLQQGEVIAFPTDTVYGVACALWNPAAIDKIFRVKERSKDKPIPILIGNHAQIAQVADLAQVNQTTLRIMQHFWPGALTVILPKHASIPSNLSPLDTVGVRMPNHETLLSFLEMTGPLAVTSANKSGGENPTSAEEVYQQLGGKIALILDGGRTNSNIPSTVLASKPDGFDILRLGAITEAQIYEALQ
jgi:L-threonylcarbamoyladenylate synthase